MRSKRLRIDDFSGRALTLADGSEAWETLKDSGEHLLLFGLGPGQGPFLCSFTAQKLYWLDAPETLAATQSHQQASPLWTKVSEEQALSLFARARVLFYRQNLFLAPNFWFSLLGRCFAQYWQKTRTQSVYVPGHCGMLLHREIVWACTKLGFGPIVEHLQGEDENALALAFAERPPAFCLSVNGCGLDERGRLFALFQALQVPCALWIVDNPWHVLSRFKLPWWKEARLFVTDPSFIQAMRSEGARHVAYLPLACAPHMWRPLSALEEEPADQQLLFVGRSAFPDKERYFAAIRLPKNLLDLANSLQEQGSFPDIHWWYDQSCTQLWPGTSARLAGAGAELYSQKKRVYWLKVAHDLGCRVIGDQGWQKLLPQARLSPPVDYYGSLPQLYSQALAVLNVTSLQLPQSLNQRHFDVWAAGGFLITDATNGLQLFPEALTREIALQYPSELSTLVARIRKERGYFQQLKIAWRDCLATEHTYLHRLRALLETFP